MKWIAYIFLFLPLLSSAQKVGVARAVSSIPTSYGIDTITGGVWTWFSDPRALYVPETDEVVIGTIQRVTASAGRRRVASLKNNTVTLGPTGWSEGSDEDDHNLAVIVRLPTDTFFTAYSDHVGSPGLIYYRISTDTTISTFSAASTTGSNATYSQLHVIGDTLFHIWRDAAGGVAYWVMRKSGDGGRNWTNKELFFIDTAEPAYLISRTTSNSRIDFFVSDTHPGNPISDTDCDLFHFYMERDSFFAADGTYITSDTVTTNALDLIDAAHVFDADTTNRNGWVWDVRASSEFGASYPVLVYATIRSATNHDYRIAKWTGSAWSQQVICTSEGTIADIIGGYPTTEIAYSGGATILQDNIVFVSRKVSGNHELWKYMLSPSGGEWVGHRIVEGDGTNNKQGRPFVPVGWTPDCDINLVWWSGYYNYFDLPYWNTQIRYGKF